MPELFHVPSDGSAAAERMNRALPPGGTVQDDFLPLDAGRVLFRADQESDDVLELFLALEVDDHFLPSGPPSRFVIRHP